MDVLQLDLDMVKRTWNRHKIRKNFNLYALSGKPEMLFAMLEMKGNCTLPYMHNYCKGFTSKNYIRWVGLKPLLPPSPPN